MQLDDGKVVEDGDAGDGRGNGGGNGLHDHAEHACAPKASQAFLQAVGLSPACGSTLGELMLLMRRWFLDANAGSTTSWATSTDSELEAGFVNVIENAMAGTPDAFSV